MRLLERSGGKGRGWADGGRGRHGRGELTGRSKGKMSELFGDRDEVLTVEEEIKMMAAFFYFD